MLLVDTIGYIVAHLLHKMVILPLPHFTLKIKGLVVMLIHALLPCAVCWMQSLLHPHTETIKCD